MYLFLLTIIPLTLLIFINSVSTYTWKNFIPQIVFALFAAAVFCGIKEFFIFSLSIKTESFFDNFAQIFLRDSVIPLLFLTICHLLLCRDENDYKTEAFFVLLSFFYSLYIPYFIIADMERNSIFHLFLKPLVFIESSFIISQAVEKFLSNIKDKKNIITGCTLFTAAAVLPGLIETAWYFSLAKILWLILFLILTGLSGLIFFNKYLKIKHQSLDKVY